MNSRPLTPPPDRRVWSERLVRISGFRRFLPTRGSQRIFPFVVLFATLVITAVLAAALSFVIDGWEHESFTKRGDVARSGIRRRVDAAIGLLRAASTLKTERQTYRDAVRNFIVDQPLSEFQGIQSVGFCERVTVKEKAHVLDWLRHEFPGGSINFRPDDPPRSEWYPIVAVEPLEPNRWSLGWDLFHEDVRRSAMERARDANRPAATKRVTIPIEPTLQKNEPGFYIFMPVYREGAPTATLGERKDALQGFTFCLFRFKSLLGGIFPEEVPASLALRVYDGTEAGRIEDLVYQETEDPEYVPKVLVHPLEIYGVNWTLEFVTQPGIHQTKPRVLIPWIAIGGVICSLLLFLSTFALVHARMDAERIEGILREKTMELARSNTDLERFAYVASHDLREPLRMVTSYVQLLEKRYSDKLDADAREFIGFAVDGATRMNEFLDGLLYLSRVARDPGVHDPTDSDRALKTSLVNLKQTVADSSAHVTMDPLPSARINETQLLQLFQNLIGNAIKFQKNGNPKVHVSATRDGDFVRFSVKDNGIGIDPAFADQVFEVFRRLHTRDHYPGSGIGLAICKRIVEQRGGKIWFDSKPDQGTTFYFTLPAA